MLAYDGDFAAVAFKLPKADIKFPYGYQSPITLPANVDFAIS
jgi:hypothetical protein